MYAKCTVIFGISFQLCRLSFSQTANSSLQHNDLEDNVNHLLNLTQHVINSLNNVVSIFNDSIAQLSLEDRVTAGGLKAIKKNPNYEINTSWGKWIGGCSGGGCCGNNSKKDCCDDVEKLKQELDKLNNCYKSIASGPSSGCANSEIWIDCQTCKDVRTNQQTVLAIPKQTAEKMANWADAKAICAKYNASLISIESKAKQDCVATAFPQYSTSAIWTSGAKNPIQGKFLWADGNTLYAPAYTNWCPNQPDNCVSCGPSAAENCVDINFQDCLGCNWPPFCWNDADCTRKDMVVCEFPLQTDQC